MAQFLIIAASSGIGQAMTAQLRDAGHQVITTARDDRKITPDHVLDARDFAAVDAVVAAYPGLDGVACCAGSLWLKPAHMTSAEAFAAIVEASLTTAFATVRAAGRHMNAGGSVVLFSSAAAQTGLANHEVIAAAKAGVIGLARSAAASYAGQNLRFNCVAPGLTETPLTTMLTGSETARKASEAMHALGRIGSAEEVARAAVFLLDPANSWITGQVLGVDGGLGQVRPRLRG